MDVIKTIQRFVKVLSVLTLVSLTTSPLTEMFGIPMPTQLTSVVDLSRTALLITAIAFIAFFAIVLGLGYFVLTGFQGHKTFPHPVKVVAAFLFGGVALMLSSAFGTLIPIPLLPTLITAIVLWAIIRFLSKGRHKTTTIERRPSETAKMKSIPEQKVIDINEAERIAVEFIKKKGIDPVNAPIKGTRLKSNNWEVSAGNCIINVSRKNGGVTGWEIG